MEASLVKFIKKIPPSGGGPAFKLTLPHQIVHTHLLHLVDEGFELAPSAEVQTSWQASIAPRRNKERSEYTLQGWKLFAEAHRIQAGDQVSFELVSLRRMVVRVIQAADPSTPVRPRERQYPAAQAGSPPKATKYSEDHSPSRNQHFYNTPDDVDLWMDASLNGGGGGGEVPIDEWNSLAKVSEDSSYMETGPSHVIPQSGQKFYPWVPQEVHPSPQHSARFRGLPSAASYGSLGMRPGSSPESPGMPRCSSLSALASSGTPAPASNFYSDLLHSSPGSTMKRELSHSPVPDSLFDMLGFDKAEEGIVPSTPSRSTRAEPEFPAERTPVTHSADQPIPPIGHQLGNLTTTIQKLQDDANHYRAQAERSEDETAHLHSIFASQQTQLDRQAREALRAAMGLEKCAAVLAGSKTSPEGTNQIAGVAAEMTNCLGVLKGTLWQLLVLANYDDDACTHHSSPGD